MFAWVMAAIGPRYIPVSEAPFGRLDALLMTWPGEYSLALKNSAAIVPPVELTPLPESTPLRYCCISGPGTATAVGLMLNLVAAWPSVSVT